MTLTSLWCRVFSVNYQFCHYGDCYYRLSFGDKKSAGTGGIPVHTSSALFTCQLWLVPNYSACWQKNARVNNLPTVITVREMKQNGLELEPATSRSDDLTIALSHGKILTTEIKGQASTHNTTDFILAYRLVTGKICHPKPDIASSEISKQNNNYVHTWVLSSVIINCYQLNTGYFFITFLSRFRGQTDSYISRIVIIIIDCSVMCHALIHDLRC